jgi:hypothetical protein
MCLEAEGLIVWVRWIIRFVGKLEPNFTERDEDTVGSESPGIRAEADCTFSKFLLSTSVVRVCSSVCYKLCFGQGSTLMQYSVVTERSATVMPTVKKVSESQYNTVRTFKLSKVWWILRLFNDVVQNFRI